MSAIRLRSVGQLVGSHAHGASIPRWCISTLIFTCFLLVVINLEPQRTCLEFQLPPAMNRLPRLKKKWENRSTSIRCFGGQYTADTLKYPHLFCIETVVACICSVLYSGRRWCFMLFRMITFKRSCMFCIVWVVCRICLESFYFDIRFICAVYFGYDDYV